MISRMVMMLLQVLAFRDARHAFGGFESVEDARWFAKRMQHLPASWCCDANGSSIPYSMFHNQATPAS